MIESFESSLLVLANTAPAVEVMREYILPLMKVLGVLAGVFAALVLVYAGYLYMTSSGRPDELDKAKRVLRNALVGLVLVIGSAAIVGLLMQAYGQPTQGEATSLPALEALEAEEADNGLVEVLIQAVTGFLNTIIQAVATPFLAGLDYFTKATPLMAENPSVFNLWLVILAMANVLLILVLVLIGFQVMSAGMFGFEEASVKQLLPRFGLVFVLMNSSIFIIDGVIELSNVMILALTSVTGASTPWETLTAVVENTGGQGVAALLVMLAFLIFTVFLLVYYVMRLVTLYIGAVLAPLVFLVWLVPGFRDFSETAIKTYLTTVFVLFVHVVILLLAASLFTGMASVGEDQLPNTLMSMIVGLATVIALLKTQGLMMQFSYVSMGARNARMLGGQFINGVSYLGARSRGVAAGVGGVVGAGVSRFRGGGLKPANATVGGGGSYRPGVASSPSISASRAKGDISTGSIRSSSSRPEVNKFKDFKVASEPSVARSAAVDTKKGAKK